MTNLQHGEYGNIERLHELIELETRNISHIKPLRNNNHNTLMIVCLSFIIA